ncbi:MAG: hypothetical protein UX59_C0004G0020 [Microgenomates group bacterium GW2011_GWA1_46_7]|nr:MAG: hypothetical protein UX59_C0004G0020 [Microgenomates group bacterium GW2011_GWA1_46_7]
MQKNTQFGILGPIVIKESYTDFMLIRLARELATIPGALMNYKKFRAERSAVVPQTHDEQVYECPELAVRNKIHEKAGGTSRIAASQGMHSYGETEEGFAYVFSTAKYCPQNNCGVSFDEDVANYVNRALRVIHGSPETDYTPEIIKYAQEVVYHRMLISLLSQESFRPVIEAFQKREDYSQLVDIFQEHHLCANIFSDESLSIVILAGGISGTLDSATGFKDSPSQSFMQKTYPFYEDDLLGFIKSQKDLPQFLYDQTLSREDRLRWLHAFAEDDGRTRVHEEISGVKLGEKSAFLDKAERALQRLKDEGRHAQDEKPFVRMISKDEEVTGIVAGNRLGSLAIAILRLAWAPDGTPTCFRYIKKDNLRPDPTANTWWTPDLADLVAVFARIYKNTSGKSSVEHYQNEARALALASGIFSSPKGLISLGSVSGKIAGSGDVSAGAEELEREGFSPT